jgi:K+-sensing histidine kinase KdpD
VVLLSARAGEESRIEGLEAGADDYLVKPFSARELMARIETHLNLAKARREREEALRQGQEQSERQREEMNALFMQAQVPIAVFRGRELVYELANARVTEAVGRDVLGKSHFEVLPELADSPVTTAVLEVMETGQTLRLPPVEFHFEIDGKSEPTWWNLIFSPIHEPDGTVERVMVLGIEITQEVWARQATEEAAARLRESEASLRQASMLKDQFLGLVSHELRTPISTVVANALILLRRQDRLSEEQRSQALQDIATEGQKLQGVVENLLLLTRIEASGALELKELSLADVVTDSVESLARRNPGRSVRLHEELGDKTVRGQAALLTMVVDNLLLNADKYSPRDAAIEVWLRSPANAEVEVQVRDSGIGIESAEAPGLFTPFFRTSAAKDYAPGMGLGLAVCKRIIEAHGGRIWYAGRVEGGSDFSFALPLATEVGATRLEPVRREG